MAPIAAAFTTELEETLVGVPETIDRAGANLHDAAPDAHFSGTS
jgi:hypothetical protein